MLAAVPRIPYAFSEFDDVACDFESIYFTLLVYLCSCNNAETNMQSHLVVMLFIKQVPLYAIIYI